MNTLRKFLPAFVQQYDKDFQSFKWNTIEELKKVPLVAARVCCDGFVELKRDQDRVVAVFKDHKKWYFVGVVGDAKDPVFLSLPILKVN